MLPLAIRGRAPSVHVVIYFLLAASLFIHTHGRPPQEQDRGKDVYVQVQKRIEGSLGQDHEDMNVEHKHARDSSSNTVQKAAHLLGRAPPTSDASKQADKRAYDDSSRLGHQSIEVMLGQKDVGVNVLTFHDVSANGWEVVDAQTSTTFPRGLTSFLRDHGLPYRPSRNINMIPYTVIELKWPSSSASIQFQGTQGKFSNAFNSTAGVLVSARNLPPKLANMDGSTRKVPQLRDLSDIIGLSWLRASSTHEARPLKWWIFYAIDDSNTFSVMRHIVLLHIGPARKRKTPPRSPGWKFSASSTEGLALLGSAHGKAVASTLARNVANFGGMRMVSSISMFRTDHRQWCLAFHIQDASEVAASLAPPSSAEPQSAPRPDEPVVAGPSRPQANAFPGFELDADMPDIELSPDTLAALAAYDPDPGLMEWDGDPDLNRFGNYEPTVPGADAVGEVDPEMDVDDPEASDPETDADADGETDPDYVD